MKIGSAVSVDLCFRNWVIAAKERAFIFLNSISRIRVVLLLSLWLVGFAACAQAAGTVKEYAARLVQVEQATDELIDSEPSPQQIIETMTAVKQLIPAQEDVELDGQVIRTNNVWLHESADIIIKNAGGDEEQVRSMLIELADKLYLLEQRVSATQNTGASQDQRARLESILSRREYLPDEKKESAIRKWLDKLIENIVNLLAKLFGSRNSSVGSAGSGTIAGFRIAIIVVLLAAASFGLVKLLKRRQGRNRKKEDDVREVLGEELPDDITSDELLANARKLARDGDFRSAIRRAYIALLCELEQRGKVRLHRAKTNRDYLDELKPEQSLYPAFSVMTGAFEHVWYGQEPATESEFSDFITLYQETVK